MHQGRDDTPGSENCTWDHVEQALEDLPHAARMWRVIRSQFSSAQALLNASAADLVAVKGVGWVTARQMKERFEEVSGRAANPEADVWLPQEGGAEQLESGTDGWSSEVEEGAVTDLAFPPSLEDFQPAIADVGGSRATSPSQDRLSAAVTPVSIRFPLGVIESPDSRFSICTTKEVLLGGDRVGQIPVGMEPNPSPVAGSESAKRLPAHGYRRLQQGCECRSCRTSYCDTVGIVALRIEGWTLEAIGDVVSLTRERVRQISQKHAPWRPWEATRMARQAEQELLDYTRRTLASTCPTCGGEFPSHGVKRYCTTECRELFSILRYHIDEERRHSQRVNMARWVERNAEQVSALHYRHAMRILRHGPNHGSGRRWLIEGSKTWHAALDACRRDLPIFDNLPNEIRKQVQEHLGKPVDETDNDTPTGITAEEAWAALDAFFTDEELS